MVKCFGSYQKRRKKGGKDEKKEGIIWLNDGS